jgi:hypothetical protein
MMITFFVGSIAAYENNYIQNKPGNRIEVPFTYLNGLIQLKIKLNGVPLSFIYDTGAEYSILTNHEVAYVLDIRIVREVDVFGSDLVKKMTAYVTEPLHIELYETQVVRDRNPNEDKDVVYLVERERKTQDVKHFSRLAPILILENDIFQKEFFSNAVSGIIGASFFSNMMVQIDFRKQRLTLYPYGNNPNLSGFVEMPVSFSGHKPVLSAKLKINPDDDKTDARLLIDTGCSIPLLLLENIDTKFKLPDISVNGQIGVGLGGNLTGWIGLAKSMEIGDYQFNNLLAKFQNIDSAVGTRPDYIRDGLLGNEILNRFTVIIDNINKKVYFKPNRYIDDPIDYDKSGLTIFASGKNLDEYYIKYVIPGSPADIAGVKPDDRIIQLQFWSYKFWSVPRVAKLLRKKENKLIRMRVLRAGEKIDIRFRLKDMYR